MVNEDNFFQRIKSFQTFETASGPIEVPVLYKDVISMQVYFSASIEKVRTLLPTDELKPISIGRGKALYGIVCFEYRDTAIGPYNEVGFGVPCRYKPLINIPILPALFDRRFSVGFYVHHLPVTTKIAYDAGVEIWGYPKFLAKIKFEESQKRRTCILQADEKEILTLEVKKGLDLKPDRWNFTTYTVKDNMLLKTTINSHGKLWASKKADSATLSLGDHPVSEELRSLQLETKPLKTMFYPEMQTILNAPSERFEM